MDSLSTLAQPGHSCFELFSVCFDCFASKSTANQNAENIAVVASIGHSMHRWHTPVEEQRNCSSCNLQLGSPRKLHPRETHYSAIAASFPHKFGMQKE